jgi:hypothetical protein
MSKEKEFTKREIKQREDDLTAVLDAKNLVDLENRQPQIVECIRALLKVGHSASKVGRVIRGPNPQMWVESKFAESVARALLADE